MRGLKGKRFIIGGGATGMGAALALRLTQEGANVCVGDVNEAGLKKLLPELQKGSGKGMVVTFDLADDASISALVQKCVEAFGGLDGVAIPGADLSKATMGNDHDILNMDVKIWERTLRVNLLGHAMLMKAAIPHMIKAGGGSIVTVSSNAAFAGLDYMPAYAASKSGLHALVRHVARIGGPNKIRCNFVAPGIVMTEGGKVNMTQAIEDEFMAIQTLKRFGEPDDLASAMAFLLSDEASWLTGQGISVNGGASFRD
jgi:NAD(P)-dependent dehydrogenase (short-subunit alcohol dehydrogenase family)